MGKAKTLPPITNELLSRIVEALRNVDPNILAVFLFGSAVYAPDWARDIDLLVVTREPKDLGEYLDAAIEVS